MIARRYALLREIGRGGMGAVWLARDEVLGREVAMKRVGLFPGGSTPDLVRAEREAKLAAKLNHPHVVAVFDFVSDGDAQWLVMEYVDGTTLAEVARSRGGLPPEQATPILLQAAEALAAAHRAGIVHRDVKPSNILVTADGTAKLTDFGIARARTDSTLTQTGLVTGSPAYLAPEVASGATATPESDVWSLGATAFQALTGRPPYDVGDNVLGALYKIVHEEPPRTGAAGPLAPLLEGTMAKDPQQRWPMAEVHGFLNRLVTSPMAAPPPPAATTDAREPTVVIAPNPLAPPPSRKRSPLPWIAAALAVVIVVGLGWLLASGDDTREQPRAGEVTTPNTRSTTPSETETPTETTPPADASAMTAFVESYLATAADDPSAGFTLLTPAFQRASGGLRGYTRFWGDIRSATAKDITADADRLTVSYDVRYKPDKGKPFEDHVELRLAFDGERYLIAAETG